MSFLRDFSADLQKKSQRPTFFCELSSDNHKETKNRDISTNRPGHGPKTGMYGKSNENLIVY